jgi:mRNA-degrading endonuclease toxin of MazEF toxin-antitoxin module
LSHPRCGGIYALTLPGAEATHVVVLTEDLWNARMGDSVVVPLYAWPEAKPSPFLVEVSDGLRGHCTRVQSMAHEFIGSPAGACAQEAWVRLRIGVRRFLDIDRRMAKTSAKPPSSPRSDWWPRQNDVHFASNPTISATDKLYAIISDDDWNSRPETANVAAVRLTSRTKSQRLRWEVSVGGGFVVAGDVYSIALTTLEPKPPPSKYPPRLTDSESAAIAVKQKSALTLS